MLYSSLPKSISVVNHSGGHMLPAPCVPPAVIPRERNANEKCRLCAKSSIASGRMKRHLQGLERVGRDFDRGMLATDL